MKTVTPLKSVGWLGSVAGRAIIHEGERRRCQLAKKPDASEVAHLVYIPKPGFVCPGDGWPAADHEEPSKRLAAQKIRSGFFRDRFLREEAADNRESKASANAKAEETRVGEIAAADDTVAIAQTAATETRRKHGRS